jgi:hypothetical protein
MSSVFISRALIARALVALVLTVAVSLGGIADAAPSNEAAAAAGEARAGLRFVGIELRPNGIGPCSPSTPTPCSVWVYRKQCRDATGAEARVLRVRTYMVAADPSVVGFRLRARLVPRFGSAAGIPWAVDVETFASRPTAISRLMDVKPVSDYVDTSRRWDLVIEARFDRRGRPDDVRIWRDRVRFDCT